MLLYTLHDFTPFPSLSMMIDPTLIDRINALNDRGVSRFKIARAAGVMPPTVHRFADGVSTRMNEETYLALKHAVETFEGMQPVPSKRGELRKPMNAFDGFDLLKVAVCSFALAFAVAALLFGSTTTTRIAYINVCAEESSSTGCTVPLAYDPDMNAYCPTDTQSEDAYGYDQSVPPEEYAPGGAGGNCSIGGCGGGGAMGGGDGGGY